MSVEGVQRPGVGTMSGRLRHRVESPQLLAGPRVVAPDIAGRAIERDERVDEVGADHQHIPANHGR